MQRRTAVREPHHTVPAAARIDELAPHGPWAGHGVAGSGAMPPTALAVVLELIGAAVFVWLYRFLGFHDRKRRDLFRTTGRVDRALLR